MTQSKSEILDFISREDAVLLYFSTTSCSVGEAVEPKVKELIASKFPKMKFESVDINFQADVAAHFSAFTEPTVLVFFDGRESIRKSRSFSVSELEENIERLYQLFFE